MSFILDALKKSESERARQNGPTLIQARVVPRRRGMPVWAIVVGVILLANLGLIAYALLRAAPEPATATAPASAPAAAAVAAQPPAPVPVPVPQALPPPAPSQDYLPPGTVPQSAPPPATVVNPADFQPARPPSTPPRPAQREAAGSEPDDAERKLPTAAELSVSGMPPLELALHVYDDDPASRYVLLNSRRLREGETTIEGVRVERITREGVVLSWRGQRFRLTPGE